MTMGWGSERGTGDEEKGANPSFPQGPAHELVLSETKYVSVPST